MSGITAFDVDNVPLEGKVDRGVCADVVFSPTPEIQHYAAPEIEDTPNAHHGTEVLSRRNVANV